MFVVEEYIANTAVTHNHIKCLIVHRRWRLERLWITLVCCDYVAHIHIVVHEVLHFFPYSV